MHRFKRALTLIAVTAVCSFPALSLAACGSTAHFVGGVAAHHIANHFARTPAARRRVNKVFCLYHGHRVLVDLRHHHLVGAALNAYFAYHSCKAGFGRSG